MLTHLFANQHIDLFYGDESGFDLVPQVSYGWQAKGQYVEILSRKGGRQNVFGMFSTCNEFHFYLTAQNIDSQFIIDSIDDLCGKIQRPTVLVLDNASIHRSSIFINKIEQWMELNLFVFFLPKYSPHLNLIETLWRKIKYEWITVEAYRSAQHLHRELLFILNNIGNLFSVNFKELLGTF